MQTTQRSSTKTMPCPKCKNKDTDRIPRAGFVKAFLFWLPIKHFACYRCGNKFYAKIA